MSAIGPIIDNYEAAKQAEAEKNYLLAARYYRICSLCKPSPKRMMKNRVGKKNLAIIAYLGDISYTVDSAMQLARPE